MSQYPLTPVELAYAHLVLEEHQALTRNADTNRDRRMRVLLDEKGIPSGVPVQLVAATETAPAMMTTPETAPEPPSDPAV